MPQAGPDLLQACWHVDAATVTPLATMVLRRDRFAGMYMMGASALSGGWKALV